MVFSNAQWMTPPASGSVVSVGNSALFNSANSEDLSRGSMSGTATTWTASFWVYRGDNGQRGSATAKMMFTTASDAGLSFGDNSTADVLAWYSGSYTATTAVFRDIGWYHMVVKNVAGTGTVYVNGESVLTGLTVPTADATMAIGSYNNSSSYLDGYMAEWVFIDGTALEPTSFAEYDSTGTFWTPKSSAEIKALTFGTNGFYLDNTTNAQTDASGEGNNFTNNNTVTLSTHTPTNLNALWNPLSTVGLTTRFPQLSAGNTTAGFSGSTSARAMLTLPVFYNTHLEFTVTQSSGSDTSYPYLQVFPYSTDDYNGDILVSQPAAGGSGGTGLASGVSIPNWTTGDRVTLEIDTTNGRIYVFINGSAVNSANPGAGSGFTFDFTMPASGQLAIVWISQTSAGKTVVVSNPAEFTDSVSTGYFGLTSTIVAAQITRTKSNLEEYFDSTLYEGNGAIQRVGQFLPFTNSFTVANSALFNSANEEYFSRTFETPTDQDVWSLSWWMKTGNVEAALGPRGIMGGATHNKDLIYVTTTAIYIAFNGVIDYQIDVDDPASFHHYYLTNNSGTLTFYIDGVSQGTASAPTQTDFNSAVAHTIGAYNGDANWFDGYMSQFVFVDGTVIALSAFGQVDTSTGRWVPKDVTTTLDEASDFGNNGFFLNFANSSDMGNDVSGNNHDFTSNNTVVQVDDSPTVNFGTLSPVNVNNNGVLSNGNRTNTGTSGGAYSTFKSGLNFTTEKIFVTALVVDGASGADVATGIGVAPDSLIPNGNANPITGTWGYAMIAPSSINIFALGASAGNHSISVADGDQLTMAVDGNTGNIWFGFYDTSAGTHQYLPPTVGGTAGNPALGTLPTIPNSAFNGGKNVICSGGFGTGSSITFNLDSSDMPISLPTDYLEFKQDNLTEGESYQTAFSWIKNRDATDNHMLFDRVRGISNDMHSNASSNQVTNVNTLQRFLNGGVQVGNDVEVNTVNESYVAWNWYMETAGSGTSNTDGTINTTATLVDTNIGLSISQFTGTGSNATIGHGLGVVPQMYWVKGIDGGDHWYVYHANNTAAPQTDALLLNGNGATFDDATLWNDTAPTSSLISLGSSTGVNQSSKKYLAMAFAPSQFTSIGGYIGNGNANGTFVPTVNSLGIPLKVQWVMIKRTDAANSWQLTDTVRTPNNASSLILQAQLSNAELDNSDMDNVTGGFKLRSTDNIFNSSGGTYVYLAFGTPLIDVDGRIITGF